MKSTALPRAQHVYAAANYDVSILPTMMQETRNNSKKFSMMPSGTNEGTMNEIRNDNKNFQEGEEGTPDANHISDVPVNIISVPTKVRDGNTNLQFEVSPTPLTSIYASDAAATSYTPNSMGFQSYRQSVGVSPMPPTPNPVTVMTQTPSSQTSKDTLTLAALYHSSRRSRRESPSPMTTSTSFAAASATTFNARSVFPPPPLASASPKIEKQSIIENMDSAQGMASLYSSASESGVFRDNWSTSRDSFPGFIQSPPLYSNSSTGEERQVQDAPHAASTNESYLTPLVPVKPTLSRSHFDFTPNTTMDRQLLNLANESSTNICIEEFSKFSTRSRSEFEDLNHGLGQRSYETTLPATKKQKSGYGPLETMKDFDHTQGSRKTNLSYNVVAYPTPEIRPLNDRVQESIQSLLALSNARPSLQVQQKDSELEHEIRDTVAQHDNQQKEAASNKRKQDIIRRKVQRLLLIRHATRCNLSESADHDYVCPVMSHCAEGKKLAVHIRKCKDVSCHYKWCLTTRDVLGHYRSCRDRKCEICGPVRAMHRRDEELEKQNQDQDCKETGSSRHKQRSHSDNSMGTIDVSEWLNANMS